MNRTPHVGGHRGRIVAVATIAILGLATGACGNEIVKAGEKKALSGSTTTLPAFAGDPPREAVNCSSEYFDNRQLSSSDPLDLPVEFPGAPDGSELCGVDTRTGVVAYTAPISQKVVAFYYAAGLTKAGCAVAEDKAAAETSNDITLTWTCGSHSGHVVVASDVGAFDIIPDQRP